LDHNKSESDQKIGFLARPYVQLLRNIREMMGNFSNHFAI